MTSKRWQVAEPITREVLGLFPEVDPVLLQLLWNRNLTTQEAIDEFVSPEWSTNVHDPYLFRHMRRAVERVYEAMGAKQKVAVFGDYDADGVSAAAILASALKRLGADLEVYLPHREREGYGLNNGAVDYLHSKGAKIIITCDCGIANAAQVAYANSLGVDVIVTDHHQRQAELPEAFAILHCGLEEETYPFKKLSGGGVAFKFVQGLLRYDGCPLSASERESFEKWLLDLVAISTVADMVPLTGENRTLTKYGLVVLRKTKRLGLRKLIEVAALKPENLDTYSISFQVAPRINAAGRLDHANAAYALLMSENEGEATELARALNLTNTERQKITDEMFQTAREQIGELKSKQYLVHAFDPSWSLGMVGLVAGKLVQEYGRPALVLCENGDHVAGSGRSGVGGFDLAAALTECKDHLTTWGGHKEAAGFSLPKSELEPFLKLFNKIANRELAGADLQPVLTVDLELPLTQVTWQLQAQVAELEPVGQQNPRAKFLTTGLSVAELQPVGREKQHLKLTLAQGAEQRKFILFRQGERGVELTLGAQVDVVYEVGVNEWNGNRELELKVVDIKTV